MVVFVIANRGIMYIYHTHFYILYIRKIKTLLLIRYKRLKCTNNIDFLCMFSSKFYIWWIWKMKFEIIVNINYGCGNRLSVRGNCLSVRFIFNEFHKAVIHVLFLYFCWYLFHGLCYWIIGMHSPQIGLLYVHTESGS